jgi:hypothetical protein
VRRIGLLANIEYLQACEFFDDLKAGRIDGSVLHPDTLYERILLATGSESLASAYRTSAIKSKWKPTSER